jgi:hypothetical protein
VTTAHVQHIVQYTPTSALLEDVWTTYTYWPGVTIDQRSTLPPVGTEVEIVTSDFTPGTRPQATIADAATGKRYGTVCTDTLFVHHRNGGRA